jgi:hypothetical protein
MSSTTDTSNRDDADCSGGGTWANGKYSESKEVMGLAISGRDYCTEVSFAINTSFATPGTTYRFMVSYNDIAQKWQQGWRGLESVSNYATLTMSGTSEDVFSAAKETSYKLPNCDVSSNWGCETISSANSVGYGSGSGLVFDDSGVAWRAYYDFTNSDFMVMRYVGSGGSGCGSGQSTAWTCSIIDNNADTDAADEHETPGAIDPSGRPWFAYAHASSGDLRVARYVGTGGYGCNGASTEWICYNVMGSTADLGVNPSIAIDNTGTVWVTQMDWSVRAITISKFTPGVAGVSGTGCDDIAWTCVVLHDPANDLWASDIAIDKYGNPWIAMDDEVGGGDTIVANYVGSGGSCTNTAWQCTVVDSTADTYFNAQIAFDNNNQPWTASQNQTDQTIRICTNTGSWSCSDIEEHGSPAVPTELFYQSLAISPTGEPWVTYASDDGVNTAWVGVAKYVGSGGSGCNSSAWTCEVIASDTSASNFLGKYNSLAFDSSGTPWLMYYASETEDILLAKRHNPAVKPVLNSTVPRARNARYGLGQFYLDPGKSPNTAADGTCASTTDLKGYCGIFHDDGNFDSITTLANQRAIYTVRSVYPSNTILPSLTWVGRTNLAPNTSGAAGDIVLQVFRFGSTNAWENVKTDSTTAGCSSDRCDLSGSPSGTASEYFDSLGGGLYAVYFRVYQEAHSSGFTFKVDQLNTAVGNRQLRGGKQFLNNMLQPYRTETP